MEDMISVEMLEEVKSLVNWLTISDIGEKIINDNRLDKEVKTEYLLLLNKRQRELKEVMSKNDLESFMCFSESLINDIESKALKHGYKI